MEINQELNEQVARKLGWKKNKKLPDIPGIGKPNFAHWWRNGEISSCEVPIDYCGSIQAAWEIMTIHPFCLWPTEDGKWLVYDDKFNTSYGDEYWFYGDSFLTNVGTSKEFTIADTAPMAIVLAFLKLP